MSGTLTPRTDAAWRLTEEDKPGSIVLDDQRYRESAKLETELSAALETIADIRESDARVMAEKCAGDERHCTCVPALRRGLAEKERELEKEREQRDIQQKLREQTERMLDAVSIVRELSESAVDGESLAEWVKRMCGQNRELQAAREAIRGAVEFATVRKLWDPFPVEELIAKLRSCLTGAGEKGGTKKEEV